MNTTRRLLDVAVGASVTVFLLSCGEATQPVDKTDDKQSAPQFSGKADSFEDLEQFERDGECDESEAKNDPDCQLRIASWNVQQFSANKASEEEVIDRIAETIQHFDLVAIQEVKNIREKNDRNCPRNAECPDAENCGVIREELEEHLNQDWTGRNNWGFAFSRQVRHERYLYVYDKNRVSLLDARLVHDPGDSAPVCAYRPESTGTMVRQPYLGIFQVDDFSFALLNVHVAPLQANQEIDALMDFEDRLREAGYSDVMILGDLNADCRYLSQQQQDEFATGSHHWLFRGADTAVSEDVNCGYDQMIVTRETLEDLTGQLGVAKPMDEEVSDHYPIWANFYTHRDSDEHDIAKLTD